MTRPASLLAFFLAALGWFVALTLAWMPVAKWTAYPATSMAHVVLEHGAPQWIRSVHKSPDKLEAETRIEVMVNDPEAGPAGGQRKGELDVETQPVRYTYGLPLFIALLAASRSRHFIRRALLGYAVLLVPQTFCIVLDMLKQIATAASSPAVLGVARWQVEGIALGYQFGALLLPTLAPVMLWLWLERGLFAALILEWWLRTTQAAPAQSAADGDVRA